ncbi:hypothetical protein C8Q73DRAFT_666619 [Cubamyces lactineus]|nr:hypothetical protein C8Q73DRAFT_666619 [Cubamyces lactineus]
MNGVKKTTVVNNPQPPQTLSIRCERTNHIRPRTRIDTSKSYKRTHRIPTAPSASPSTDFRVAGLKGIARASHSYRDAVPTGDADAFACMENCSHASCCERLGAGHISRLDEAYAIGTAQDSGQEGVAVASLFTVLRIGGNVRGPPPLGRSDPLGDIVFLVEGRATGTQGEAAHAALQITCDCLSPELERSGSKERDEGTSAEDHGRTINVPRGLSEIGRKKTHAHH